MSQAISSNGTSGVRMDFTVFRNIIDGKYSTTPESRRGINPATEQENADVPISGQNDLDRAVEAAKKAQKNWGRLTWGQRQEKLRAYADLFETYRDEFVSLLIAEQGKAYVLAQDEFNRCMKQFREGPELKLAEEGTEGSDGFDAVVRYVPIGVSCALVPWNYPMMVVAGKIVPALLAGNALIVKPSPDTPYCNIKMVELGMQVFPPGVLQVLSGDHDLGPKCTAHPGIEKISFTGSVATGKLVMESCSKTLKRVVLELGGNDAAVICEDVDIDAIVPPIAQMALLNSGQVCMAIKRIYVHSAIYERFSLALAEFAKTLMVGPGTDHNNFIGPLQNQTQKAKVMRYLQEISSENQNTLLGGSSDRKGPGFFVTPTIVDNPPDTSSIVQDEPFGPIFPLLRWDGSDEDIIARANQTPMGLGASVWSADVQRAEKMARGLEAGTVWVNTHLEVSPKVSFGGHKSSGIGTEWGINGLKGWCNSQTVWTPRRK